jgi:UDP-glucose 4-epimerase
MIKSLDGAFPIALITGAHGFIGRHLALSLSHAGYVVCGLGHGAWPTSEAKAWGVSLWVNGDIVSSNLRFIQQQLGTPSVVYHLAGGSSVGVAIGNPREDFFRTVATTCELLDWVRLTAPDASIVSVSSAAVYGGGHSGSISEEDSLNPFSPYGHHKLMMEQLCHSYASSYNSKIVIARLFSVYGSGLKKQLLWDICTKISSGDDPILLGGSGNELRDWTDVRDVVRALVLLSGAATNPVPIFNIGTGFAISVRDISTSLAKLWSGNSSSPAISFSGKSRKGDPFSLIAEPSSLAALNFTWEIKVEKGLRDYIMWFRENEVIR